MRKRGVRNRRDLIAAVPAGHWREAQVLAERGFPRRRRGHPMVLVVDKRHGTPFFLDALYHPLEQQPTPEDVRQARLHHVRHVDGWLPRPERRPSLLARANPDDFEAFWIAD